MAIPQTLQFFVVFGNDCLFLQLLSGPDQSSKAGAKIRELVILILAIPQTLQSFFVLRDDCLSLQLLSGSDQSSKTGAKSRESVVPIRAIAVENKDALFRHVVPVTNLIAIVAKLQDLVPEAGDVEVNATIDLLEKPAHLCSHVDRLHECRQEQWVVVARPLRVILLALNPLIEHLGGNTPRRKLQLVGHDVMEVTSALDKQCTRANVPPSWRGCRGEPQSVARIPGAKESEVRGSLSVYRGTWCTDYPSSTAG